MVLLDTCTVLWLASDPKQLSDRAAEQIRSSAGGLFVSAVSAFEIGLKTSSGKLTMGIPPADWYAEAVRIHGLKEAPVDGALFLDAVALPPLHKDPCDRIIIATAAHMHIPIITPDPLIARYPQARVIW